MTKWEDLEADAMYALGGIGEGLEGVDGTMNTMSDNLEKSFSQRWQAIWRNAKSALLPIGTTLLGLAENIMPKIESAVEGLSNWFGGLSDKSKMMTVVFSGIAAAIGPVLVGIASLISMFGGAMTALAPFLLKIQQAGGLLKYLRLGLTALTGPVGIAVAVIAGLTIGFVALYKNSDTFRQKVGELITKVKELATQALAMLQPAIAAVVGFFKMQLATIQQFWEENSSTIIAALENIAKVVGIVMKGIFAVIDFIMPAVLALIRSVWGNIKGVISGALNIIMGAVKVFSGLFSGNFSKMWEGVKQMFSGAVTFLWNLISLTFFGKVMGGARAFIGLFRGAFTTMWSGLKTLFSNSVGSVVTRVTNAFSGLRTSSNTIFSKIVGGIKDKFTEIVTAAKNLPKRIGDGIGSMASKVTDGVKRVTNNLASTLGTGINGVIGGINWVLGKIGLDKDKNIPKWSVPKYAHGTHGHPGGLAMVGDGIGSNAGRELIQTPSGELALSPSTETLINLPKGSQVLSAKKTKDLLASIPQYANGIGGKLQDLWEGTKKAGSKAWEGTKNLGNKAKNAVLDVWEYATNPGKLLNKALELLGISKPKGGSLAGNMAGGAYNKVKNGAVGFLKKQFDNSGTMAGSGQGFGSAFRLTSRRGFRINPVTGIGQMHQGDDWGARAGTLIPAQAAGKVIQAGYHAIRGNFVRIQSGIMDRLYQHNQRNMVKVGQNVRKGQAVGTVGSTGRSTGPHLHYEVRRNGVNINPFGLETGGLVNSEQLVRVGEKNRPEMVIPLHPSRRTDAMKLLAIAGKRIMGGGSDKGVTRPNQLANVATGGSPMDAILAATVKTNEFLMKQNELLMQLLQKDGNVYMDSGALVGAIGDPINTHLGNSSKSSSYMNGMR